MTLETLSRLVADVPATVLTVAVAVNPTKEETDSLLEVVDRVQFHGSEAPDFCQRYGRRGIKAFRISARQDLDRVAAYRGCVGAYLLDSYKEGQAGGTGHCFAWGYLQDQEFDRPTFLAGGLNPANVGEAMRVESVDGLDVSSGLESRPGVKDEGLMRRFFDTIRDGQRRDTCRP